SSAIPRDPRSTLFPYTTLFRSEPAQGTMAYKLKHGQQVNILLLGMGGEQNDAPYLTDSIMAVSIDPTSNRVMMASIPRDLVVHIDRKSTRLNSSHVAISYAVFC